MLIKNGVYTHKNAIRSIFKTLSKKHFRSVFKMLAMDMQNHL